MFGTISTQVMLTLWLSCHALQAINLSEDSDEDASGSKEQPATRQKAQAKAQPAAQKKKQTAAQPKAQPKKAQPKAQSRSNSDASEEGSEEEEDIPCEVCGDPEDGDHMLICDGCEKGYHMYCLKPKLKAIPEGDWFCKGCSSKQAAGIPLPTAVAAAAQQEASPAQQAAGSAGTTSEEASPDDRSKSTKTSSSSLGQHTRSARKGRRAAAVLDSDEDEPAAGPAAPAPAAPEGADSDDVVVGRGRGRLAKRRQVPAAPAAADSGLEDAGVAAGSKKPAAKKAKGGAGGAVVLQPREVGKLRMEVMAGRRRVKEHKEQVVEKRRAIEALENGTVVRPWLSCAACWRAGPYLSVSVMSGVEL